MEQLRKSMIKFALDHAEDLVYEARDIYCDAAMETDPDADYDADILEKLSDITDAIVQVKILITSVKAKKVEEFDEEPYEKSEKDCMWERE